MRSLYEIYLLELRQGIKESEEQLRSLACVDILLFQKIKRARKEIQRELINHRLGIKENTEILKLMEG